MADIGKLLENKMFLQYLSGAGAAMSAGQPIGPALGQITGQNLAAQSQAATNKKTLQMLVDMLSGKLVPGSSIKMGDKGDTTINLPRNIFGGTAENTALATEGSRLPGGSGIDWASILNPPSSSVAGASTEPGAGMALGPTAQDLVGLSPEDVSRALTGALGVESLRQKILSGLKPAPTFVKDAPGYGDLTLEQYKALPVKDREYVSHVLAARRIGETPLSRQEFDSLKDKDKIPSTAMGAAITQYVNETGKLPPESELRRWTEIYRTPPVQINIGETVKKAEALEDVKSKKYFTNPKGLVADVDKYINSEEVQSKLFTYFDDPQKREVETVRAKEKFIRGKVAAAGGTIVDEKLEGRTFVFKVKWPDGDTSEVRYAN